MDAGVSSQTGHEEGHGGFNVGVFDKNAKTPTLNLENTCFFGEITFRSKVNSYFQLFIKGGGFGK